MRLALDPADMVTDHIPARRTRPSRHMVTQELTTSCHVTAVLDAHMLRHAASTSVRAKSSPLNNSASPVVSASA